MTRIIKLDKETTDKHNMDYYINNTWEVLGSTKDREGNEMFYIKNTETDWEPDGAFYPESFEGPSAKEEDRRETTSEILARQTDEMQELYAYIEHAEEDLLLVCQGRTSEHQDMHSVVAYLESAQGVALHMALRKEGPFEKPKLTKAELLNRLLDLRGEFATIDDEEDTDLDNELLETIQGYATRHNIEVVHEVDGDINFKERPIEQYWVAWNPEFYNEASNEGSLSKIVEFRFFEEANGFDEDDIDSIKQLKPGETHHTFNHSVLITRQP